MSERMSEERAKRAWAGGMFVTAALLAVGDSAEAASPGPSGREIMARNLQATSVPHIVSSSTLTIGAAASETRSKTFSLWRKAAPDGVHYRTLTRFTAPAEISGEGVLFDEKVNGQNEVLLYLPRYKKVRRVEARAQRSSFMGSSFSYADMTTQAIDDYRHDLLRSEPCPGEAKVACFVVLSVPVNDTVKANHGYARRVTWLRSTDAQAVQAELYDRDGDLWKRVAYSDIREIDAEAHRAIPHLVRIDDLKAKRFSTVQVHRADVRRDVPDGLFNEQGLSREI